MTADCGSLQHGTSHSACPRPQSIPWHTSALVLVCSSFHVDLDLRNCAAVCSKRVHTFHSWRLHHVQPPVHLHYPPPPHMGNVDHPGRAADTCSPPAHDACSRRMFNTSPPRLNTSTQPSMHSLSLQYSKQGSRHRRCVVRGWDRAPSSWHPCTRQQPCEPP